MLKLNENKKDLSKGMPHMDTQENAITYLKRSFAPYPTFGDFWRANCDEFYLENKDHSDA